MAKGYKEKIDKKVYKDIDRVCRKARKSETFYNNKDLWSDYKESKGGVKADMISYKHFFDVIHDIRKMDAHREKVEWEDGDYLIDYNLSGGVMPLRTCSAGVVGSNRNVNVIDYFESQFKNKVNNFNVKCMCEDFLTLHYQSVFYKVLESMFNFTSNIVDTPYGFQIIDGRGMTEKEKSRIMPQIYSVRMDRGIRHRQSVRVVIDETRDGRVFFRVMNFFSQFKHGKNYIVRDALEEADIPFKDQKKRGYIRMSIPKHFLSFKHLRYCPENYQGIRNYVHGRDWYTVVQDNMRTVVLQAFTCDFKVSKLDGEVTLDVYDSGHGHVRLIHKATKNEVNHQDNLIEALQTFSNRKFNFRHHRKANNGKPFKPAYTLTHVIGDTSSFQKAHLE